MPAWLILTATIIYFGGLFVMAWRGDYLASIAPRDWKRSPIIYSLALGVYCTSWTFFGAVGSAANSGLFFLHIYLGPALLFLFWPSLIRRIAIATSKESITSLSDFLASRYGRSRTLAAIATIALTAGTTPYIALQLKSVGMSFQVATQTEQTGYVAPADSTVLMAALILAVFAILFGARHADATRPNHGLMRVLAFEAIIKLLALVAVCVVSVLALGGAPDWNFADYSSTYDPRNLTWSFVTITLLSIAAILCLPRQFHVAMIERKSDEDLKMARWLFPAYLGVTCLVVVPIALAGLHLLPSDTPRDLFVMAIPEFLGHNWLTLFVFLGGFSAATGMVIVAAIALSTIITNDLIVPLIMRFRTFDRHDHNIGQRLLMIRRSIIVGLLLLSYLVYFAIHDTNALQDVGLLSFAGAAQLFPALIGAVYWKRAHRNGAIAGITVGSLLWAYTLFLPEILGDSWMADSLFPPANILGTGGWGYLTHGVVWSLGFNLAFFILFSVQAPERLRDRVQANVFSEYELEPSTGRPVATKVEGVAVSDLMALASRFLKPEAVANAFVAYSAEKNLDISPSATADWRLIQRTEKLLASALGSSSARVVLGSAISQSRVSLDDLLSILDEKSQAERFDRHLLQATLENISLGVSVVDGEQNLVAWNSAYVRMFDLPDDLVRIGRPIADIIRLNAERGECGPGEIDAHVEKRLSHIRAGRPHVYERVRPNGAVLKTIGHPMPGGGYVTTFTDITEDKVIERRLRDAKETLELRVAERTSELEELTQQLDAARLDAEGANASKTRFLAAASHDLLQPLNAARLFTGALEGKLKESDPASAELAEKIDRAIQSSDQLLRGLLDISRLDHGVRPANVEAVSLNAIIADIYDEAEPIAEEAGLSLRIVPSKYSVLVDSDFLKSILRNFVSNALRYTNSGGVLLGARKRGDAVRIEVWDTGIGVPEEKQGLIFEEFHRLEDADKFGVRGAGLGLAIAKRMAGLMNAQIGLRSKPGQGSVFFVDVCEAVMPVKPHQGVIISRHETQTLVGMKVLCLDDEPTILDGMEALLTSWGCIPFRAQTSDEAIELACTENPDFVFLDYQLTGEDLSGVEVYERICEATDRVIPAALLTADNSKATRSAASAVGLQVFNKPVSPQELQLFMARLPKVAE